jgi:class 3 adenylate cyclase/tetratricopeptide (TPR) repeat protein
MADVSPLVHAAAVPSTPSAADAGIEALRRLNRTAPAPLVSRARKARLVGERKPVTAVFADIVGSTTLAESIDPEDWTLIINAAFDEMSRCIFDYEGTIAQLQGDAIISFFGAPVAHEDDPERAVRAALAMTAAMESYREEVRQSHGIDFRIRIGISTGLVLVGNVGSDLRYDYTAIGDTMNLASRLEGAAEPGQVLIADRTEHFVRALFELEDIGSLDLKDKTDAVRAFRVVGEQAVPGPTRGLEGLDSSMVGRDAELAELLDLSATVRAGRGRSAVIIAEPGLGKSRLLRELRSAIDRVDETSETGTREMSWVVGQGSPFGARMPFHLVTSLLLDLLGLTAANPPEEVGAALHGLLGELLPGDTEAIAYLAFLMGLDDDASDGHDVARANGEFVSERLSATVLRLLKGVAAQGPLVVVIEDLHWADAASVELLKAVITAPDEASVLVICATRDEPSAPGWEVVTAMRERSGRALTEIALEPLDEGDSSRLVANLLEIESLAPETREIILTKAEGNPFFVEEVIRMLIDQGVIEQVDGRWRATGSGVAVAIPDTLHGLILARIDRLPQDARRVLRIASCIERRFPLSLLEDIVRASGLEVGIGAALVRLEAANLVTLFRTAPELAYRFSHALIQDAAYETVLRQERREWHGLVAEAILARWPDREDEMADRLARHFELAGNAPRAVDYLLIAAERALARNAMVDARGLFAHAAELLGDPSDTDTDTVGRQRLRILMGTLASGLELVRGDAAMELLATGRDLAEGLGDWAALSDVLFWEVTLRETIGERPEQSPRLREAVERLESLGDVAGDDLQRAQALSRSGNYLWWSGQFHRSLESLERASTLFRENGDVIGASMAESYMAADLANLGRFEEADRRMQESRALADQADELTKLDFHIAEASMAGIRGDYAASIRFAGECFEGSMEMGAMACAAVSGMVLGGSQMAMGETDDARDSLERSLDYANQNYMAPMRLRGRVLLASLDGADGKIQRAEDGFRTALSGYVSMGGAYGQAEARLARGRVLATHPDGDAERALEDLDAAAEAFSSLQARPALARTYRARGMALARLGQADEANRSLELAASMATEMGLMDGPWPQVITELPASPTGASPIKLVN